MNKSSPLKYSVFVSLILIIQLILLYYIKYSNQGMSLNEFSMQNLGNILDFVFTFFLITGIIIYYYKFRKSSKTIVVFLVLLLSSLILAYLFTLIKFPGRNVLLFKQQADKVLDAFVFTVFQFIMFCFISYVWFKILSIQHLTLIRSVVSGLFMLIFFLLLTFLFIKNDGHNRPNYRISKNKKNLGVVLGAAVWSKNKPSPSLSSRVDKAIELYHKGFIGRILFTGSNAPGELSEARVAYNYAISRGMDEKSISLENQTTSTVEQISFIKNNLMNRSDVNGIIVISDAYHLVRVLEISKFYNINIKLAPSNLTTEYENMFYREVRESIALIVFWSFAI